MKDLIDIMDLSPADIQGLIDDAVDMMAHPDKYADCMKGKRLAALFYEPSTRTRFSFLSAMQGLGGDVIGFAGASTSSVSKGESVHDTAMVVSQLADIIVMRHTLEGAPLVAAQAVDIPVINAGDGGHAHPTQTLADLCTIYREKGRFENLTLGICGDLRYGRTVHSLLRAMMRYPGLKVVLISPDELRLPRYVKAELDEKGIPYIETVSLEGSLPLLDVLYMTRIQKERFKSQITYDRLKNSYILDMDKLNKAKQDCIVLHPLPRVNEISVEVDEDPRACYFKQVHNGRYMRMALIRRLITENDHTRYVPKGELVRDRFYCHNERCITSCEQEIHHVFKRIDKDHPYRCIYCEARAEEE
jgi:aspartate carbamoyltransferase catalytic subunit